MDFKKLANQYRDELLDNVLPFWLEHSQDLEFGGYFSCLDREGKVFDTDKFIWLQGREVWMFSMLYNKVEKRQEWLIMPYNRGMCFSCLQDVSIVLEPDALLLRFSRPRM